MQPELERLLSLKDSDFDVVYRDLVFTRPTIKQDGIHIGRSVKALVDHCIIDFKSAEDTDENVSVIDGSTCLVKNSTIINGKKAILIGSGDNPALDANNVVGMHNCVIKNAGRRCPEIQDSGRCFMDHCIIENWGDPDFFDTRNFGIWVHNGALLTAEHCIFKNSWSFQHLFTDIANHIGNVFNEGFEVSNSILDGLINCVLHPVQCLLPGKCRGLMYSRDGFARASSCYTDKWWITIGPNQNRLGKSEAENLYQEIMSHVAH